MAVKIVYLCGEDNNEAQLMAQHKILADNGFVVVSYGEIKNFEKEKESISKTMKGASVVWVLNTNKEMGENLKAQVKLAEELNKKIVFAY